MLFTLTMSSLAAATLLQSAPQDAAEVLARMQERQAERWETVDNYTVYQTMQGLEFPAMGDGRNAFEIPTHYQKYTFEDRVAFGLVPANEYQVAKGRAGEHGEVLDAGGLERGADGQEMMADVLEDEMRKAGAPMLPGLDYPGQMLRDNATFMRAGAQAIREADAGDFGRGDAAASLAAHDEMARAMRLVGREKLEGREVFHLRAEGLDRVVTEPGAAEQFTLHGADMWVDAERYVTLKTTMEGDMRVDGEQKPLTFERLLQDYRQVGPLYESHRQVMRLTGMMAAMDDKQRKEMEEARKQIEQMEAQMDQLPAMARGMVERQIAQAKQQMEMMSGDGALEIVYDVVRIDLNDGPAPPKGS